MERRQCIKYLAGGLAAAAVPWSVPGVAAESWTAIPKSLWVWRTPLSASADVMALVKDLNIGKLFYSIPPADRPALYAGNGQEADQVRAFRAAGVTFYAVVGDPAWSRRGANLPRAIEELFAFQARSKAFDGLCLDVEPQALPEWKAGDREGVVQGYAQFIAAVKEADRGLGLPLAAAVVPSFSNIAAPGEPGRSLLESVAAQVDESVLMAYRSNPQAALRIAANSVQQLDAVGKPWWFGVTTFQNAPEGVGYAGSNRAEFGAALVELDSYLRRPGSRYAGIAINDYPSLTAIARR